jgi:hypothetical protein
MAGRKRTVAAGSGNGTMQSFDDKHPSEFIDVSVDFSPVLTQGVTLSSALVGATLYTYSPADDDSPSDILDGVCEINSTPYQLLGGKQIPTGHGVIQRIEAGTDQAIYILTFFVTASDGQEFIEQVVLVVNSYGPAPIPPDAQPLTTEAGENITTEAGDIITN